MSEHICLWLKAYPYRCVSVNRNQAGQQQLFFSILLPFTGLSFAVAHSTAPEPALGSWTTFCMDKLTLSGDERVSLNVNLIPLPYLVLISVSLFLLTDYSSPQEMCSGIHLTGSLCLTVCDFLGYLCLSPICIAFKRFSVHQGPSRKGTEQNRNGKCCTNCHCNVSPSSIISDETCEPIKCWPRNLR